MKTYTGCDLHGRAVLTKEVFGGEDKVPAGNLQQGLCRQHAQNKGGYQVHCPAIGCIKYRGLLLIIFKIQSIMLRESTSAGGSSRRYLLTLSLFLLCSAAFAQWDFETKFFKITVNDKGYITSMKNNFPGSASYISKKEFSPPDEPSPLLCLYAFKKKIYYYPQSATYAKPDLKITYNNGIVATVEINDDVPGDSYLKLKLKSLSERKDVDDIQWGPIHTGITNILGEVLGVAKDTTDAVNYAIGMFACNDNTAAGPSYMGGDLFPLTVQIHSPHPTVLIPAPYSEGELYPIGGTCDVCFYTGLKPYTKMRTGPGGEFDAEGRISFFYHSSDRRKKRTVNLPNKLFESPVWGPSRDHYEVEPVPTEDCVGSTIAFYGAPEDITLKEVLEKIVVNEGLMHLTTTGKSSTIPKWIRDPARTMPAVQSGSRDDDYYKLIEYADKMGFPHIQVNAGDYFAVHQNDDGNFYGTLNTSEGYKSFKEVCEKANAKGISIGVHTKTTCVEFGSVDVRPFPNKNLCCQYKRKLVKGICSKDIKIEVDNPLYFDEGGSCWAGSDYLNYIKIGTEIIKYDGISKSSPFVLQKVERGAHGTKAQAHPPGSEICRLSVTTGGAEYEGFVPDIALLKIYGEYYAQVGINTGMRYFDYDGQEFLFNSGHGQYAFKVFYKAMQKKALENGFMVRMSASSFTDGSWLYQTVANYGGDKNVFDSFNREFRPQGIAMNDAALGSFFTSSFSGGVEGIKESSTVQHFENLEAMSVGVNASYNLCLSPGEVESCPVREEIFKAIKTWERARAANAFPRAVLQKLRMKKNSFHLSEIDDNTWELYLVKEDKSQTLYQRLTRAPGY